MEIKTKQLKNELIIWYKKNKRSFPWRETKDPWKILIIETLAQQTQLERANQYYEKFLARFPTPRSMSNSSLKVILKMWSGLGYNNRAKRLYEASKILEKKGFDEIYPNFDDLPEKFFFDWNLLIAIWSSGADKWLPNTKSRFWLKKNSRS